MTSEFRMRYIRVTVTSSHFRSIAHTLFGNECAINLMYNHGLTAEASFIETANHAADSGVPEGTSRPTYSITYSIWARSQLGVRLNDGPRLRYPHKYTPTNQALAAPPKVFFHRVRYHFATERYTGGTCTGDIRSWIMVFDIFCCCLKLH